MTPNDIDVLLHYNSSPAEHPRISAPAVKDAIHRFVRAGVFEADTKNLTEKGRVLVEMLCATPMPVQVWVDGR